MPLNEERGLAAVRARVSGGPGILGIVVSMLASMDKVGRLVIPKELRDELNLGPDAVFTLVVEGGSLRLTPLRTQNRRIVEVDGWPVLAVVDGVRTTDADVQRWRDADQR